MALPRMIAKRAIEIKNELNAFDIEYWSSDHDGYCKHGTYVGGCGIDWMCGPCESGYTNYEIAISRAWQESRRVRKQAYDSLWDCLLKANADLWDWTTKEDQKVIIDKFTDLLKVVK